MNSLGDLRIWQYRQLYLTLQLHDEVLYMVDKGAYRTCVPKALIPDALRLLHLASVISLVVWDGIAPTRKQSSLLTGPSCMNISVRR